MGNEGYNVYARSPDGNQVVAIVPRQFVRVDFDNAGEMEITVPKRMIDGISILNQGSENCTSQLYTCGTSAESTSARVEVIAAVVLALFVGAVIGFVRFKGTTKFTKALAFFLFLRNSAVGYC